MIRTLEIHTSDYCSLYCNWCYNNTNYKFNFNSDVFRKAYSWFYNHNKSLNLDLKTRIFRCNFLGGEPLLFKEKIMNFVFWCKTNYPDFKVKFSIITNGILINSKFLHWCKNNNVRIQLSIDGCEQAHDMHRVFKNGEGSFKKVVSNLELSQKIIPNQISIRSTISPQNCEYLMDSVKFLYSTGLNLNFVPTINDDWEESQIEVLSDNYSKITKWWIKKLKSDNQWVNINHINSGLLSLNFHHNKYEGCNVCKTQIVSVHPNGNFYPCHRFSGNPKEKYVIGDIDDGINKKSSIYEFLSKRKKKIINKTCDKCEVAYCQMNCPYNYYDNGNISDPLSIEFACRYSKIIWREIKKIDEEISKSDYAKKYKKRYGLVNYLKYKIKRWAYN